MPPPLPKINGYRILSVLGSGGMGQGYKAHHLRLDRIVALKVIRADLLAQPDVEKRFYREARAAARLSHPNLATVYDAGESEGLHYLALEFVDGTDLGKLIQHRGPLSVATACQLI